jgi:hypothetical protein
LRQYEKYLVVFYLDTLPLSGVQEMTIDMTGQMSPPQRAEQWQGRRVFFVTPQCLEKDINSGSLTYLANSVPALAFLAKRAHCVREHIFFLNSCIESSIHESI